jgi:preprotein translocase subunit SecF
MLNTLKYSKILLVISAFILLFGIVSLSLFGLKLGIDFKGGSLTELEFSKPYDMNKVREVLNGHNLGAYQLQSASSNGLLIKAESIEKEKHDQVLAELQKQVGEFKETRYESIGPVVGRELTRNAFYQLGLVSLGIVLYLGYAFRKVPKPVTGYFLEVWLVCYSCAYTRFVVRVGSLFSPGTF